MESLIEFLNYAPHKMVFQSLLAQISAVLIIIFYQYIYPKRKMPYWLILFTLSIPPIVSIFRPGVYESGDFTTHVTNTVAFYDSLRSGIFIPRWAADLNAYYGFPAFIFIYPLPYYISSLFHVVGFSFIDSVKMLLISTYILSGVFMFLWLKGHVKEKYALLGAIFYLYAPYHFVDLHFRAAVGEVTAMAVVPLVFLLIDKTKRNKHLLWEFLTAISVALLILSHPAVSLLAFPVALSYSLFMNNGRSLISKIHALIPFVLGLLLSSYYWIPVIFEGKYTIQTIGIENEMVYPKFTELLFSPWRYGFLFQGPGGELSFLLGYAHWLVIIIAVYLFLKNRLGHTLQFLILMFFVYLFLILEISKPVWEVVTVLKKMEFPYRILSVLIFISSAMGAMVIAKVKSQKLYLLLIFIAISTTILNWGNRGTIPEITDSEIIMNLPTSTARGAGISSAGPIWRANDQMWMENIPRDPIESLSGEIKIISEKRTITKHEYIIENKEASLIKENTYYFPGWSLYVNGYKKEIEYENEDFPGIIMFELEKGIHHIKLEFKETPIRLISLLLSNITLFICGISLIAIRDNRSVYSKLV